MQMTPSGKEAEEKSVSGWMVGWRLRIFWQISK